MTHGDILVRDSKDKAGPALHLSPAGWDSLMAFVRAGKADFGII